MIAWAEVHWPRPLPDAPLLGLLTRLASDGSRGPLVWEARAEAGTIRYLLGAAELDLREVARLLPTMVPGATLTRITSVRREAERCGRLRIRQRSLALNLEATDQMLRALLGALASATGKEDVLVVQVVLGSALSPESTPKTIEDPTLTIWDKLLWGTRPASGELRTQMRGKLSAVPLPGRRADWRHRLNPRAQDDPGAARARRLPPTPERWHPRRPRLRPPRHGRCREDPPSPAAPAHSR
ncbi:MAG: hypothetical protein QM753_05890 [Thermomicrobiales bacterium]